MASGTVAAPATAWQASLTQMVADTIVAEVADAPLGDKRLSRRVEQVAVALATQPSATLTQALGEWAALKGAYRLFDNRKVTPPKLLAPHQQATAARVAGHTRVLAIQDTTFLDYTRHPATEVGPINHHSQAMQGLVMHTTLAMSTTGEPLGILAHQLWSREAPDAQVSTPRARPIEEKESYKWLTALQISVAQVPPGVELVTVADGEAEMFALFQAAADSGSHVLVRAYKRRRLADATTDHLWPHVRQRAPLGSVTLELPARGKHPARQMSAAVRVEEVELPVPGGWVPSQALPELRPQRVWAITVDEVAPPPEVETPVRWQLLTTLACEDMAAAVACVAYYRLRFEIEALHRVFKSGCQVEKSRLRTARRLTNYLTLMLIVAFRLHALRHLAHYHPDASCDRWLAPHEWRALYVAIHQAPTPPERPPPIGTAVVWIGRLGGFLARRRDGSPGMTTLWRGWQRLQDMAHMYLLLHPETYG